uniref:Snf2-related CREBBP activator protein n=1 Tax=Gasterosteus aculeatus aculeatus TaxID=481459 RepID=A0AAQ4Q830_GASAC
MQSPPAPLCPPLAADTQITGTLQELQHGSQTDKESSPSNSQTNQVQTPREMAGLFVTSGTTEKGSVTLEYNPETGTNVELGGKGHAGENILLPKSQIRFTASSPSLPQPDVGFKVRDAAELLELSAREPLSSPPPLPASGTCGIKQTDLSNTQPNLTGELQKANCLEPGEMCERATELVEASHKDGQPSSAERLETGDAREQPPKDGDIQRTCDQLKGVQLESIVMEEQANSSSLDFTVPPECSSTQEGSSKPSSSGPVVEVEKSLPAEGVPETTTTAELVHSDGAQEIVVVGEDTHIAGDWTNMHLNQSYLLQREDGSVCEAGIINELGAGLLAGEQAAIELDSQRVEVYEFCTLVEEVAEETVCASSSSALAPHSPGYEVNLFNALLEHSEEYTVKDELEPSDGAVIIPQQPLTASNSNSTNLFVQTSRTAAVGQHLVLEPERAAEAANSGEVRLVEVTDVAADAFAVEQADAGLQMVISPVAIAGQTAAVREATAACASTETQSRCIKSVSVPVEIKSEALGATRSSGFINPKLLLLKPGDIPVLKHPPSLFAGQNPASKLANAHSSWSGTLSEDCLPQTLCSVDETSLPATSCDALHPGQTASVSPKTSPNKSDNEALTATQSSSTADAVTPGCAPTPNILRMHPASEESEVAAASAYEEEESEDMEQEPEAQETASGQISSPEEGSDEEPDADRTESEMTPSSPSRVSQWIADRINENASPVSPATFPSYPGPSPSSDWSSQRRDKSSPLRGPHGKFVSPISVGGYSSCSSSPDQAATPQRPRGERHTGMAELAKHEADIEHRTQSLKREGFWSTKRLTRLTEPPRPKVHWDYLCEEMQWLSADFAQERRWKRGVARKVVRMVMRHHEDLRQKEEKAKRDEHSKIRRVASSIAKEVRAFWSSVEKVVQYKQQSRLEEKRKKALDLQLDFIVGQTEKYSDLLSQSLAPAETEPEHVSPTPQKSADFEPPCEEEDDEETIEVEEQQEGNDAESHRREIELLKEEGLLPLDQLLSTLKLPQVPTGYSLYSLSPKYFNTNPLTTLLGTPVQLLECSDVTSSSVEEDGEFTANEEDAQDEEDTIAAQEKVEGQVDHAEELDDLAREGDMSVEELLEKYKGAYASDFEAPSASGSKDSSDSEVSGDEEEETDEDESDAETNSSSSGEEAEDEAEEEESEEEDCCGDEGMEVLLKEGDNSPPSSSSRPKKEISHIAATAESLQPKGYTLATTKVKTPIPFLLHGTLREYQHIGLDWLVTMYEKKLNGILADEMGLGKTIQTIALLAHLACEKGNWGPHLIIVPTSVMLNWEMELKRWCPGFKILTYFGSQKERKLKRQGWTKPNAFHVCITSYKLVLQDHQAFRRKSWRYLILDEAQNIKNFKSQRWQSLLNFNSHRRLLLTGTPLQNSLMELWSLMHFLMPHVFQSHREFKEWFSNPLTGMIEGSQEYNEGLVKRLHKVLRPFLLRRIKIDVEKQMPKKYEHVVRCRLSKRQRFLYDDFMAQASTRETLASGHFMSVINILMQLRKVCNHPNLFDPRPIQSPFITKPIVFHTASLVQDALEVSPLKRCDLSMFDLVGLESRVSRYQADVFLPRHKVRRQLIQEILESPDPPPRPRPVRMKVNRMFQPPPKSENRPVLLMNKPTCSVPPAAQNPKPPPVPEVSAAPQTAPQTAPQPAPQTAPVVQQVVCTVTTAAAPRPSMHPTAQIAVRSGAPRPVLTVRPPAASCAAGIPVHPGPNPGSVLPQRVLLSPDMQARLPSGEVVSIAQLASLAGRPVSSCQGSKPVTFQLQGNKLTLSGAQIHQVPGASPRPVQVPPSIMSSPGVVKIVVRQAAGKDGGPVPTLAVAPSPRVASLTSLHPHTNTTPVRTAAPLQIAQRTPGPATATAHYTIAPPGNPGPTPSQPHPPRPVLKVVQPPPSSAERPGERERGRFACVTRRTVSQQCSHRPSPQESAQAPSPLSVPHGKKVVRPNGTKAKSFCISAACVPALYLACSHPVPPPSFSQQKWLEDVHKQQRDSRLDFIIRVNENRCAAKPAYGREVLDFLTFLPGPRPAPNKFNFMCQSRARAVFYLSLTIVSFRFTFAIPPVEAPQISIHCCHPPPSLSHKQAVFSSQLSTQVTPLTRSLHRIQCYMRTQFPDLRLIQYDCGKLQTLHTLLRKLKTGGHRVLIFTQMTRMLDVLEQFLNYHGHIYLRLDGSTRVEMRQSLMERFNADRRIFCFILSTRSGGVGVNLTGADTVVFYDSDWNPTMDAQAQDRCHRIGQTRDVHIYRLISERTVEENILKKANQKRMLGDMAIEGGNFTTAFFNKPIRELFDMSEGEKREAAVELSVTPAEEEETVNKQSTTILEQALCRAEDEEDIVAASQAKAEQVAELAEFNENIPLDDGGEQEEVEELSKAEQEIAALVEQLTPIERYAMNFLETSLEDVCKEELKQAEEQVEAARKGLDQAKEEGLKLHASSDEDNDDFLSPPASVEPSQPARRGRKPKDKAVSSTRTSGRLRGASPEAEPEPTREVPERLRCGLRGRGAAKDPSAASATPPQTDLHKTPTTKLHDVSKSPPARDPQTLKTKTLPNRSHPSPVPSPPTASPHVGKLQCVGETDGKTPAACSQDKEGENDRKASDAPLETSSPVDHQAKDDDCGKDHGAVSPPSTSSRSPRKRQSADGEVLRGLVEDSPSAKVLRKLPGRLVTVVEEKEPRRRRRRGSGTGGGASSEEAITEESVDEASKDNASPSPDGKSKASVTRSPPDQHSAPSPAVHPPPVRSYPPYSPPHLFPDMPVLRNLPVRRRLETESRMAAQLGEQQQHLGRGRGWNQSRKTDPSPGKDGASASTESDSLVAPLKRKRGRPPKTPPRLPEHGRTVTPSLQREEGNPTLSPKRKRGRPRKDATTETVPTAGVCDGSKTGACSGPPPASRPEIPVAALLTTRQGPEDDETPNPPQCPTTDPPATPAAVQAATPAKPTPATPTPPTTATPTASTPPTTATPTASTPPTPAKPTAPTTPTAPTPTAPKPPTTATLTAPTPAKPTAPTPPTTATPTAPKPPTTATPAAPKPPTTATPAAPKPPTTATPAAPTPATPIPPTPAAPAPLSVVPSTSARCASCAPASPPTALTQVSSVSMSSIPATSTPNTTAPLPLASTVTSTPAGVQTTLSGASKAPAEPKPSVPTTAEATAPLNTTSVPPPAATSPSTDSSSAVVVDAVPASVPATTSTASVASKPGSAAPTVTTTAKSVTTKTAPVTDLSSTTSTPTFVPSTAAAPQKVSASTSATSTSSPTTATVRTVQASPTAPIAGPTASASSRTVTCSPNEPRSNVAATKPPPTVQVATHGPVCSDKPCAVPPLTTAPAGVTTPKAKTFSVTTPPPAEKVQGKTATAETPSRGDTTSTAPPTEKAVNIPPPLTSTTPSPLPTVTTTTSSPEKSAATSTPTTQASTIPAPPASVATVAAAPPFTATQISPVTPVQSSASSDVTPPVRTEDPPHIPTPVSFSVSSEKPSLGPTRMSPAKGDPDTGTEMEVDDGRTSKEGEEEEQGDTCKSQPKRRRVDSPSETKDFESGKEGDAASAASPQKEEPKQVEKTTENKETPIQKRPQSRQSSRESARSSSSSSSSSGCSTSTLTRHAHHKRTYENRHPAKKRRMDVTSDTGKEEKSQRGGEKGQEGCDEELGRRRRRRSRSSSFTSSDSDNSGSRKEHRLTRSSKRGLQDQERKKGNGRQAKKSDRNALNNANASTGGESGSDTSSVRKSALAPPSRAGKAQANSAPPEPEVLGKRCSALNAAAKLLAMKGRVDTPGHTPRRDAAAKGSSTDKNQKPKSKSVPTPSQSNSVNLNLANNKSCGSKPAVANQVRRSASRSTRQCPGSLVPPLDLCKRSRAEEKEDGSRKSSGGKEGEPPSSSRGHSACSSMSSDGEAGGGEGGGCGRSSRSRSSSSSNSSQRTRSLSSQNTEHRESRAASSGSERGRGRSESRRDRRSHKLCGEAASGSGAEGTPDRVLRSVAALAAVQARSPAASTRSSSGHHRRNKT